MLLIKVNAVNIRSPGGAVATRTITLTGGITIKSALEKLIDNERFRFFASSTHPNGSYTKAVLGMTMEKTSEAESHCRDRRGRVCGGAR
ncbi:hypothetical protein PI124_g11639 [Phytophthora idaei]|nr:hypothetical protein PI125_g24557 [Phytophthora idaei]KAG3125833.1 hypothetical protein PI126_g22594 [Phytophthora idaei]KAG3243570.1 hypothetical protein PI124_g11639 [Phytophthora idaei]